MVSRQKLIDEHLAEVAEDLLRLDPRLRDLGVKVRFDGAVAHVEGEVADPADLALLREMLTRQAGVLAVWDRVRVGGRDPVIIDVGCGDQKQYEENIGLDRRPSACVDVVADLSAGIPMADESVDQIFAVHVLEHLLDFIPLLAECHRVLRPGGVLHVMCPWWKHVNAVADPTHLRFIDTQTFKHFCRPTTVPAWYPLIVSRDDASVFADLVPVKDGQPHADDRRMARFFT
ncbi:methyltransferase domain-containing protein [Bailinhaonella thermotolerans]|uniref:Methyltransferase domain-containing protein n=1 Tax=Bailinhaonella thermotolerans TaxID=1070861 RepID=A0A3A4A901_9ACTN|nr:methyltransferase domain-containing protein [Bailinhaonella thermotolerans]RJL21732.1 methyltransferase domain-containing protein [Bailinhaonella thermotolerans]